MSKMGRGMDKTHFFCADCENRLAWRYLAKIGRLEIIPCKCKSRPSTGVVELLNDIRKTREHPKAADRDIALLKCLNRWLMVANKEGE